MLKPTDTAAEPLRAREGAGGAADVREKRNV
jgi:hypothetical protein